MALRLVIFLILNFAALAIGGLFTGKGVPSEWYADLNKAPWTPPGWVFGFAWTSIMILFAVYMSELWAQFEDKKWLLVLFSVQWVLNVLWNPLFFQYHNMTLSLLVIFALTLLVAFFFFYYWPEMKFKSFLILPYLIWMIIATSLNLYISINN